ncbi:MAG: hypothetical protein AAF957_07305 [Planctomycetota bacterium]
MKHRLAPALIALLTVPALGQTRVSQLPAQSPTPPTARPDRTLLVDASGLGDFDDLPAAVAAAQSGALLQVAPGSYSGATVTGKSLRIEATFAGTARLTSLLEIVGIPAQHEVTLGGLFFEEGFLVDGCVGEVSLASCTAINDGVVVPPPPGVHFSQYPDCGIGLSRHVIQGSAAVSLVDCSLAGRDGEFYPFCDGSPGEHGLIVDDSRVAVYGGTYVGGHGSDAVGCHGAFAGAGGDGILARFAGSRVHHCNVSGAGGTGGIDMESGFHNGCPGLLFRDFGTEGFFECAPDHVTLEIESLVMPGALPTYTITGPPGANIFLMAAPRRNWREFAASEGILHLGAGLMSVPLGQMPASGTLSRPFPAPRPAWRLAYASIELQVYARVAGQDRYSEPRTLQTVHPGQ